MTISITWDPYRILEVDLDARHFTCDGYQCYNLIAMMDQEAARDKLDEELHEIAETNPLQKKVLKRHFDTVAPMVLCKQCRRRQEKKVDYWLSTVEGLNSYPLP